MQPHAPLRRTISSCTSSPVCDSGWHTSIGGTETRQNTPHESTHNTRSTRSVREHAAVCVAGAWAVPTRADLWHRRRLWQIERDSCRVLQLELEWEWLADDHTKPTNCVSPIDLPSRPVYLHQVNHKHTENCTALHCTAQNKPTLVPSTYSTQTITPVMPRPLRCKHQPRAQGTTQRLHRRVSKPPTTPDEHHFPTVSPHLTPRNKQHDNFSSPLA